MAENEKPGMQYIPAPCGKRIDTLLQKKLIESWCPFRKRYSDNGAIEKKSILQPIFTSYVFVHITEKQRIAVLETDGVINYVHYLGKPAIIRDEEIQQIKSYLQEEDAEITTQSWESLEENIKVQITEWCFYAEYRHYHKKWQETLVCKTRKFRTGDDSGISGK